MKRSMGILGAMVWVTLVASTGWAGDFDGSRPLLISVFRVVECLPDGECKQVKPASIDLPRFLKIDFTKKTIQGVDASEKESPSVIRHQEVIDGKLMLQGAEDGYEQDKTDGLGWTLAISQKTGEFVWTGSGEEIAFIVFGAALPQ